MGLLDYYKQFQALPEEEVNKALRAENAERKARQLAQVPSLDLSNTVSPQPPHPDVVSAVTFAARRGMHRYPSGAQLLSELSHRLRLPAERIAIGCGASQLLQSAASALLRPGQALLCPWPSHPLLPKIAQRANCAAIAIAGGVEDLLRAVPEHDCRLIAIARPNDPTGELISADALDELMSGLPETVAVLLDEALIEYAGDELSAQSVELSERHPRLLVFRSFSKAWGLAGLRCGYVVGGPGAEGLIAELAPEYGVSDLTEAGVMETLRSCQGTLHRRVQAVSEQRSRLMQQLRSRGCDVADSAANFLWVSAPRIGGGELAGRLAERGVIVAPGAPLGDQQHVRITVCDPADADRLLSALDSAA